MFEDEVSPKSVIFMNCSTWEQFVDLICLVV